MTDTATGILLAAGSASRMGFPKLLYTLPDGTTPLALSFHALIAGGVTSMVIVTCADTENPAAALCANAPVPCVCVAGGSTRQESVWQGLQAATGEVSVIHDAARCKVRPQTVQESIQSALQCGSGVVAVPVTDTVHQIEADALRLLPRETLLSMQTPQTFRTADIKQAYQKVLEAGAQVTDDASAYALFGFGKPNFIMGQEENRKLTTKFDIPWLCGFAQPRIGYGEDTHRLVPARRLVLGGVTVPYDTGLLGHSDADVLCHAVMDALLGAATLGDIGRHFPDTDPAYKDADSLMLLSRVRMLLEEAGFTPGNVDTTVIAQAPRLAAYIPAMQSNLAQALSLPESAVSVKATTTEGLGPEGRHEAITARAVVTVFNRQ